MARFAVNQYWKMAKPTDERHRYGQHYTPHEVAQLLAAFAVRSATDLIFDPSCGDGRLLGESLRLKAHLARGKRSRAKLAEEVFGVDRSRHAIELASRTGARVGVADFFDIEPGARVGKSTPLPERFDAIIGNPPYIRQEVVGVRDKRRIERRLERGRTQTPEISWPRWSGRSDIYVYFFAHSTRFLKEGGRLAFLTASSWLDVGYGAALREFLCRNFRIIAIVESAVESFFADASINTSITVLAREPDSDARDTNLTRFVQLTRPLADIFGSDREKAIEFARSIEKAGCSAVADAHRIRVINQASLLEQDSGWGKYLRAEDVLFRIIERGNARLRRLSSFARVRFGVKTGANEFFYVKGVEKQNSGLLALNDIATVRRGLTTGANEFFYLKPVDEQADGCTDAVSETQRRDKSLWGPVCDSHILISVEDSNGARHAIESEYLSPVVFSLKEISGIVLERGQTGRLFFNCSLARDDLAGTRALAYIRSGERAGFDQRPTCAARDRWYSAARGMKPAPIIFPSKVGERWLVALNRAGVFEDKKLYGIFPRHGLSRVALAALLNSTWARYYTEVTCRQMTGAQAIADIDVAVAEQIMLPDPRELSPAIKQRLESALMDIARRPVLSVFEEVKRADRRRLDDLVLTAIGFTDRAERKAVLDELYAAVTALVRARLEKTVARSQESGARSQESEVRSQKSGVRSQKSEVRSQKSGVRIEE